MANENVIPAGFKPSFVTADGKEKTFTIRRPSAALAREFYKQRRRYISLIEEYKEIAAREESINEELITRAKIITGERNDGDRIAELRRMKEDTGKLREQSDIDLHKNQQETADLIVDTQDVGINWDETDMRQVRGAIDFFAISATASGFAPKT